MDDKVPTQFADVCVEVNGIRSPMFFVSPGQLNLQAPTLGALGPVTVEVITGCGGSSEQKSAPEMVTVDAVTPAFFLKVFTDPGADCRPPWRGAGRGWGPERSSRCYGTSPAG